MGLIVLELLICAVHLSRSVQSDLVFRVGGVFGKVDQCAEINDAHLGYQLFADMLDIPDTPLYVTDAVGTAHRIRFNYTRYDDNCVGKKHDVLVQTLINEDKVHFLFGSTPVFAEQESVLANNAQRLLYHCCVGPDPIYERDMKYIYGVQVSNIKYSRGAAKSMALSGNVKRLFIFYLEDNIFTSTTCESAVEYSTGVVHELSTGFNIAKVVKYTSADAAADPEFYAGLVDQAMSARADAILGCDFKEPGFKVAEAVADRGYYLKALWLTVAPAYEDFADTLGPDASEHVLTPVQWHPAAKFADPFFGTAAEYTRRYIRRYNLRPSYVSAGASAVGLSLAKAIQDALKGCSSRVPDMDADSLLFDAGVLECEENGGKEGTGYERILSSLARQQISTFFGEIALNSYRRNVALTPITAQVQSGILQATLPIEVANRALIMPMPSPKEEENGADYIGSLQEEAFIAVVVVVVGSVLVLCLAALLILWRSRKHSMLLERMLVISPDDLLIINHPVRLCDGSYECGKAMHRNTLVALEPLTEVNQKEMEQNTKSGVSRKSVSMFDLQPMVAISKDLGLPVGFKESGHDLTSQPFSVSHDANPPCDLETPSIVIKSSGSEALVDRQPQSQTTANGAATSNGRPRVGFHWQPSVNLDLANANSDELQDSALQPPPPTASIAQMCPHGPVAPQLTRAQILRLVWRSKCLQHPSVLPVSGVMWSLPSVPQNMAVLVTECEELGALASVKENKTMELDAVKALDICKDLAQALAYLHAQTHPRLRPVLQPRLAGVMLNKHCRAKLRVPYTSLLDALALDGSDCTDCAPDCVNTLSTQPPSQAPCSSSQKPARVSHHWELEDVQQFGLDIACMMCSSKQLSSTNLREHGDLVADSSLPKVTLECLEEECGLEVAELVLQCCAQDSSKWPSFCEVYRRLEELGPEMIKRAQIAHRQRRLSTLSMGSGRLAAARADELLYEVFPEKVAQALKSGRLPDPEPYSCVSLFFSDIVGYTDICSILSLEEVLDMLHRLYSRFDALSEDLDLFKVGTVGDAYMCVANVRCPLPETHAAAMARFAFGCGEIAKSEPVCPHRPELGNIRIRMGIHAGPVMGAVVGTMNRRFCLFGDTVNVASRMESTSLTDHIQCSKAFLRLLQQQWPECAALAVPQGARPIKGKGKMYTFYLFPDEQQQAASECLHSAVWTGKSGRLTLDVHDGHLTDRLSMVRSECQLIPNSRSPKTPSSEGDRSCRGEHHQNSFREDSSRGCGKATSFSKMSSSRDASGTASCI